MPDTNSKKVLRKVVKYQDLHFYQKSDVLYQLTCIFCRRFLPPYGDRTVDQMVQAARSCKQNIVEGFEDGASSTEMELKLLNVAMGSNAELREDYKDFIKSHNLTLWNHEHPRFQSMLGYARSHNALEDYVPHASKWSAEEFANICATLCYEVDSMMRKFLARLETDFVEQGGIKERMYAARTGYRHQQDERLKSLESENASLKAENASLRSSLADWKAKYDDLRSRAVNAYNKQQKEIKQLKETIEGMRGA